MENLQNSKILVINKKSFIYEIEKLLKKFINNKYLKNNTFTIHSIWIIMLIYLLIML